MTIEYVIAPDGHPRITNISEPLKDSLLKLGIVLASGIKRGRPAWFNLEGSVLKNLGSQPTAEEAELLQSVSLDDLRCIFGTASKLNIFGGKQDSSYFEKWHNQRVSRRFKGVDVVAETTLRAVGNSRGVVLPREVLAAAGIGPRAACRFKIDTDQGTIRLTPDNENQNFEHVATADSSLALVAFSHLAARDARKRLDDAMSASTAFKL